MEPIFLTCMVLAFFLTKGKVDTAAYANGKESPAVAKARLRHENRGGGHRASGRPKGSGAFRLLLATRWDSACKTAAQRLDHRAARRRDWFDRTKDSRDQRWNDKMQRRLERADKRRDRWAGLLAGLHPTEFRRRRDEEQAWRENARRDADAAQRETPDSTATADPKTAANPAMNRARRPLDKPGTKPTQRLKSALILPRKPLIIGGSGTGKSPTPVGNAPTTEGTTNVYENAVTRLIAYADQIAAWRRGLKHLSDGLKAKGWGTAVTGPTADMDSELAVIEGDYRNLAAQMKQQGDNGKEAYEQNPWVPSAEVVLA